MEKFKIGFRIDSNREIGTGHLMRSLAIAEALRNENVIVFFFTADDIAHVTIKKRGFEVINLKSQWDYLEAEIGRLVEIIRENEIEKLIIDSYQITYNYLRKIKKHTKVIYIDDYGDQCYPVDGVINYNITAKLRNYENLYRENKTELIIGTKYIPLRKEFQNIRPIKIKNSTKNILITTGGGDIYKITTKIAKMIAEEKKFSEINFHFVCGCFYNNTVLLRHLEKKNQNIIIHENIQHISKLMLQCDLAISAGGSTLYELCACGVPTICFSFVDNQNKAVETFKDKNIMIYENYYDDKFLINLQNDLERLINCKSLRMELHKNMKKVTNGKGVLNLAKKLIELGKY